MRNTTRAASREAAAATENAHDEAALRIIRELDGVDPKKLSRTFRSWFTKAMFARACRAANGEKLSSGRSRVATRPIDEVSSS